MLKSLQNLVVNQIRNQATSKFSTNTSVLLNNKGNNKKKDDVDDEDEFNFMKTSAGRARLLERFGVIKPDAKWPQYNRVIYPPTEDGKPTKNPVSKSHNINKISHINNFYSEFIKYIHHMRNMIKYPAEKLWFPAFMV